MTKFEDVKRNLVFSVLLALAVFAGFTAATEYVRGPGINWNLVNIWFLQIYLPIMDWLWEIARHLPC